MKKNILIFLLTTVSFVLLASLLEIQKQIDSVKSVSINKDPTNSAPSIEEDSLDPYTLQKYDASLKQAFSSNKKPLVVFDPTITVESEKNEILTKVIHPFNDYTIETNSDIRYRNQAFLIHKNTEGEIANRTVNSTYRVYYVNNVGSDGGFSPGQIGEELRYWYPDCLGDCKFSAAYTKKYPEVINRYNAVARGIK